MPKSIRVEIYSRPGCHLCDEARAAIALFARNFELKIVVTDVDSRADLREAYGWDIPVVMIEGREAFRHRVDPSLLEKKLREAWNTSTS